MKMITWNCQGAFRKKAGLIASRQPDIAVIQECECPEKLKWAKDVLPPTACLWFGDNPNKGIGVFSWSGWQLEAYQPYDPGIRYCVPIRVSGSYPFHLLAVWTKSHHRQPLGYSSQAYMATIVYKDFIAACHTVMVGDLNCNKSNEGAPRIGSPTQVIQTLRDLDMVSAYHWFSRDRHGQEKIATFYQYRNLEKPAHIDYQFIPHAWTKRLRQVWIGAPRDWLEYSDHCPLGINLDDPQLS